MRNVLVLQHVAHEPLGTLNPLLKNHRLRIRYVNFERDPNAKVDITKYNGLIVLGGPMGVHQTRQYPHLKYEMQLIEQALKLNIPILGICLGAQLLAATLKAQAKPSNYLEVGWQPIELTRDGQSDPFFQHFEKGERIFQMHSDSFEIPRSAIHLARSENCAAQAFKYGNRAYGIQFHLEVDQAMIERWTKIPATLELIHKVSTQHKDLILRETNEHIKRSLELSELSFKSFLDHFEIPDPQILLGSGHGKPRRN